MTLIRMGLMLAAAGLVANVKAKGGRRQSTSSEPDTSASNPSPASAADVDSPNEAERLAARGVADTLGPADKGRLFGSNSQDGPEPQTPGLPDFARGA